MSQLRINSCPSPADGLWEPHFAFAYDNSSTALHRRPTDMTCSARDSVFLYNTRLPGEEVSIHEAGEGIPLAPEQRGPSGSISPFLFRWTTEKGSFCPLEFFSAFRVFGATNVGRRPIPRAGNCEKTLLVLFYQIHVWRLHSTT